MREPYDDRFWAENHQVMSDGIGRGFRRIGKAIADRFRRVRGLATRDQSEEARKRTYCIG